MTKRGRGTAVSWPPEDQICQTRFFWSDDAPSSTGCCENGLFVNRAAILTPMYTPQGFRSSLAKRSRNITCSEVSIDIAVPWDCPKKFLCDSEWLVADGDASVEVVLQQKREVRFLEAFYPRITAIPDSPAEPAEPCMAVDDCIVSVIPLVPIEEAVENSEDRLQAPTVREDNSCHPDELLVHVELAVHHVQDLTPPKANLTPFQDSYPHRHGMPGSSANAKVMAAAPAEYKALQRNNDTGPADADVVKNLKNPTRLTCLNALNQNPTPDMDKCIPKTPGQLSWNQHQALHYGALSNKTFASPLNGGLPSPVSVLPEWTHKHGGNSQSIQWKRSENSISCKLPNVTCSKSLYNPSCPRDELFVSPNEHQSSGHPNEGRVSNNTLSGLNHGLQKVSNRNPDQSSTAVSVLALPKSFNDNTHPQMSGVVHSVPVPCQYPHSGIGYQAISKRHQDVPACNRWPSTSLHAEARSKDSENAGAHFMTLAGPRASKLCMYFNTPRGCRYGGNCAFLHQIGQVEPNTFAQ